MINSNETVILFAGLGGSTGTKTSLFLFEKLSSLCQQVHIIATTPFKYEIARQRYAMDVCSTIRQSDNKHFFDLDYFSKQYGKLPLPRFFDKINEKAFERVREITFKS